MDDLRGHAETALQIVIESKDYDVVPQVDLQQTIHYSYVGNAGHIRP